MVNISLCAVKNSERWSNSCTNQSNFAFAKELAACGNHLCHPKQQPKQRHFMSIRSKQKHRLPPSLLTASCNGGKALPANAYGGMTSTSLSARLSHLPPATMAGPRCFRHRQWRVQLSASPGGGFYFPPMPVVEIATCRL
jgi:hypothetical protein